MKRRGIGAKGAHVDLIPMIDVVFQLILFFLVSTTFIQLPGISLHLPVSSTAEPVKTAGITISMYKNGSLWLDDEKLSIDELNIRLAVLRTAEETAGKKVSEYPVRLEADEMVTNGAIIKVFDVMRQNGFLSIHLRTTDEAR